MSWAVQRQEIMITSVLLCRTPWCRGPCSARRAWTCSQLGTPPSQATPDMLSSSRTPQTGSSGTVKEQYHEILEDKKRVVVRICCRLPEPNRLGPQVHNKRIVSQDFERSREPLQILYHLPESSRLCPNVHKMARLTIFL